MRRLAPENAAADMLKQVAVNHEAAEPRLWRRGDAGTLGGLTGNAQFAGAVNLSNTDASFSYNAADALKRG